MAVFGFEGFEKRLEFQFWGGDLVRSRCLDFSAIQEVLETVQCTIVSAVGNRFFDAYVLSESSLFVYPLRIIIKTCGTTQLLRSIPCLLGHATSIGLRVCGCRYTRGSFIFPKAQPFPHTSFREEALYLDECLPSILGCRKSCIMPSNTSHSWHVYSASDNQMKDHLPNMFTVEMCMTELDRMLAQRFFLRSENGYSGEMAGQIMTEMTGIGNINPKALICDFGFDPCGYSMNGIDEACYSTIHVTPEHGYSYASFECIGSTLNYKSIGEMLKKVVGIFRPETLSISICVSSNDEASLEILSLPSKTLESIGFNGMNCVVNEILDSRKIGFQAFSTHFTTVNKTLKCFEERITDGSKLRRNKEEENERLPLLES